MLTPRRFQGQIRFFHLNSGLNDRIWPTMHMKERWAFFCRALFEIQKREDFTAHAFVLMTTHFHLLFSTASGKEHILAEEFHRVLTDLCNQTWDTLELPLFCDPILSLEYYKNAYKYVYRNPVDAGLCFRAEDYEYSTLQGLLGRGGLEVPVIDNMGVVHSPGRILEWLNQESAELRPRFER